MNRADAYQLLAEQFNLWRALPVSELLARVDARAWDCTMELAGEPITMEVSALWDNPSHTTVRIHGVVYGSSSWHTERVEESTTIHIAQGTNAKSLTLSSGDA
jgi:hypothetical protein